MTLKKSKAGYLYDFMLLIFVLIVMSRIANEMMTGSTININDLLEVVLNLAIPALFLLLFMSPFWVAITLYVLNVPTEISIDEDTLTIHRWFIKETYSLNDVAVYEKPRDKNGRKQRTGIYQSVYESRMYIFRVKNKRIGLEYYRYDNVTEFKKLLESKVENKYYDSNYISFFK